MSIFENVLSFAAGGALIWFGKDRIQLLVVGANTLSRKLHDRADAIAASIKR